MHELSEHTPCCALTVYVQPVGHARVDEMRPMEMREGTAVSRGMAACAPWAPLITTVAPSDAVTVTVTLSEAEASA